MKVQLLVTHIDVVAEDTIATSAPFGTERTGHDVFEIFRMYGYLSQINPQRSLQNAFSVQSQIRTADQENSDYP